MRKFSNGFFPLLISLNKFVCITVYILYEKLANTKLIQNPYLKTSASSKHTKTHSKLNKLKVFVCKIIRETTNHTFSLSYVMQHVFHPKLRTDGTSFMLFFWKANISKDQRCSTMNDTTLITECTYQRDYIILNLIQQPEYRKYFLFFSLSSCLRAFIWYFYLNFGILILKYIFFASFFC